MNKLNRDKLIAILVVLVIGYLVIYIKHSWSLKMGGLNYGKVDPKYRMKEFCPNYYSMAHAGGSAGWDVAWDMFLLRDRTRIMTETQFENQRECTSRDILFASKNEKYTNWRIKITSNDGLEVLATVHVTY